MAARVAFLGSPAFAVPSLRVLASDHEVVLVVTQPDRPAGRGRKRTPTAVRNTADELGLDAVSYEPARRGEIEQQLARLQPDVLVVVAFGHILEPRTLAVSKRGALNVHASLLPRWRGVAPIERCLLAGDAVTGVSLMAIDAGVDTGPVLAQEIVPVTPEDTRVALAERLAVAGARLLAEKLGSFVDDTLPLFPQASGGVTYAERLRKEEGRVDWAEDPIGIWKRVRAFYEWPGAHTTLGSTLLKLHVVRPVDLLQQAEPGTIVRADARGGVRVACGGGTLELVRVQLAGKPACGAGNLASGRVLREGQRLGS